MDYVGVEQLQHEHSTWAQSTLSTIRFLAPQTVGVIVPVSEVPSKSATSRVCQLAIDDGIEPPKFGLSETANASIPVQFPIDSGRVPDNAFIETCAMKNSM